MAHVMDSQTWGVQTWGVPCWWFLCNKDYSLRRVFIGVPPISGNYLVQAGASAKARRGG